MYNFGDDTFEEVGGKLYSKNLNRFWGVLDRGHYSDSDKSSRLNLFGEGVKFLEKKVSERQNNLRNSSKGYRQRKRSFSSF